MIEYSAKAMRRGSRRLYRRALRIAVALGFGTLAVLAHALAQEPRAQPEPFSAMRAGVAPAPWTPIAIAFGKHRTRYDLVDDDRTTVLHAVADNAASALAYPMHLALRDMPVLAWRWKIAELIRDADPRQASREDAPVRIIVEFDGDARKLPLIDRGIYGVAKRVAGRELPYATLIYIWSNRDAVGTVIRNPHTRRIQMVVASSGETGVGAWQALSRNVRADFLRAFGEEPGTVTAVGVMTDSDNTDSHAEAWYGDIRFEPAPH